jgi:hypothetical protein
MSTQPQQVAKGRRPHHPLVRTSQEYLLRNNFIDFNVTGRRPVTGPDPPRWPFGPSGNTAQRASRGRNHYRLKYALPVTWRVGAARGT